MTNETGVGWKNADWFCHGILDETLACERVYETEDALAFRPPKGHRNKKYEQHLIVIPKLHIETLLDLPATGGGLTVSLIEAVRASAAATGLDRDGFFLRANVLPPYQGTGHLHLHLLSGRRKK